MTPDKSLEAVVWCAVGGRGTLVGPIIGASVSTRSRAGPRAHIPIYWLIILGVLFILVVLFMPKGIVGLPGQIMGCAGQTQSRRDRDARRPPLPPRSRQVKP